MVDQNVQTSTKLNLAEFQALAELQKKESLAKAKQGYYKAYFLSVVIPPIGIYYFIKYVFFADGTDDDLKTGIISLILTILSLVLSLWLVDILFKQMTSVIPTQNMDVLKDLITPANQKKILELYK